MNHFKMYELLDPETYLDMILCEFINVTYRNGRLIETYVHPRCNYAFMNLLQTANWLRDFIGKPCYVNTYNRDSNIVKALKLKDREALKLAIRKRKSDIRCFSGTRRFDCPEGAKKSTHKIWSSGTLDLISSGLNYADIRMRILNGENPLKLAFEADVNWLHTTQYPFKNKLIKGS